MANRQRPARATREGAQAHTAASGRESLQFSKVNLAFGAAGFASLVLGYWLLSGGSITAAPLLLVLGYVVLLPLALIL
jgi:hypothetical protein